MRYVDGDIIIIGCTRWVGGVSCVVCGGDI